MNVVKAVLSDKDFIIKFMLESVEFHNNLDRDYYYDEAHSKEAMIKFLENCFVDDRYAVYVAKDDFRMIHGFIILTICEASYFDTSIRKYGSILEVYVDPNCRRQKLGEQLMRASEEYFEAHGIKHAELQMSSFNHGAFEFYKSLGYVSRQILLFKQLPGKESRKEKKEMEEGLGETFADGFSQVS